MLESKPDVPGYSNNNMKTTTENVRVLLVEDEIKIADFVVAGLERMGMTVVHCDNGEAGLHAFLAGTFDMVLLDVMLPKLNGFEVLQEIRQRDADCFLQAHRQRMVCGAHTRHLRAKFGHHQSANASRSTRRVDQNGNAHRLTPFDAH